MDHTGWELEGTSGAGREARTGVSRRALLRGASGALPAVLTLQSGAALAQSSNLLGTVRSAQQAVGERGRIQCIDMASAVGGTPSQLDLGPNPSVHMQYLKQRTYYWPHRSGNKGDKSRGPVPYETMCAKGGVFWYEERGQWRATLPGAYGKGVQAGFLVSATAMASFAQNVKLKTYF